MHGNFDAHANVHGHAQKVDVEKTAGDGVNLPIFDDGRFLLTGEFDLEQRVVAGFGAENGGDLLGVHGEG